MDPVKNPFSPGAGAPPPELAGRAELLEKYRIALERVRQGRPAKSLLLIGLRGVGKTVLLDRMRGDAEALGLQSIRLEAPENRSLPAMLAPQLRQALIRLSALPEARQAAERALRALVGFVRKIKIKYSDVEIAFDGDSEPGIADNGDLEHDLPDLLCAAGEAAAQAETVLALFMDELQYVKEEQLAALITALHRAAQRKLPVILVGAGLPQLRGLVGRAKSYAERLFDFHEIGPLSSDAAKDAIVLPIRSEGADIDPQAVDKIVKDTAGYAYFLQEWGKHSWDVADHSPIETSDVDVGSQRAIAALDESFFRVRFDRLTPHERRYLRAMAELGPGPHRSGDIADKLHRSVNSLAPVRSKLIEKGMIWSPSHGDTAFTVPLFDEFMKRIWPDKEWLEE